MTMNLTELAGLTVIFWASTAKMLGSSLGQDTDYPDRDISWFSSALPGECWNSAWAEQ
jgi:hypothetical protein